MAAPRLWTRCAWAAAAGCAVAGCTALTTPRLTLPKGHPVFTPAQAGVAPAATSDYREYVGVIHIHTRYSDGAGTYEDIARIANAEHLDYLIVTDHNTLQPLRDGKQGWWGSVLVLVGDEISTRAGHYLALNVTQEIDREDKTTQQIIDEVNRQGGLGIIAHPYFKKRRWTDWTVTGFMGIEAYNAAHDTLDENRLRLALWTLTVPEQPFYWSLIDRPYDPLRKWDELIAQYGRLVGIGSSDAHEIRLVGLKFAPYEVLFQLIRTHLLIPSSRLTPEAVYTALRAGHAFFAIELTAPANGFSFQARHNGKTVGIMGDDIRWAQDLRLAVGLPSPGRIVLFKDGEPVGSSVGQAWEWPVAEPGVYRVEISRYDKPWIFSNPIYIRAATP